MIRGIEGLKTETAEMQRLVDIQGVRWGPGALVAVNRYDVVEKTAMEKAWFCSGRQKKKRWLVAAFQIIDLLHH